jgi:hypothetical protein
MENDVPQTAGSDGTADPGEVFIALGQMLYHGPEFDHAHQAICAAAVVLVPGCDHASVMTRSPEGELASPAATDSVARMVEQLEQEVHAGPCVDALVDDKPRLAPDLTDPDVPWPTLRARVLATTPVRGMLGFQIAVPGGRKLGALNLFTDRAGGFTDAAVHQGSVLAAFCSVALNAAEQGQEAQELRQGLESNREIGKAIGLLMAHHRIDDAAAFEILRRTSMDLNLKLAEVAEKVLSGHHDQLPG